MRISDWSSDVCSSDLTFERRKTAIPPRLPFGLTDEFAQDESKARQWVAFLQKNALEAMPLLAVMETLRQFLEPALVAASADRLPSVSGSLPCTVLTETMVDVAQLGESRIVIPGIGRTVCREIGGQ